MPFNFNKLSILIVEDTEAMRNLIRSVLEVWEVGQIFTANNGADAFEIFCRHAPDIILADWHMAPVDGIELTRKIRTSVMSPNRMVPIILITGYSAMARVAAARDAGVTEFMSKPFSANDMAKRLAYVINKPRDFIDCSDFFGPDRRRRRISNYSGPFKRMEDNDRSTGVYEVG